MTPELKDFLIIFTDLLEKLNEPDSWVAKWQKFTDNINLGAGALKYLLSLTADNIEAQKEGAATTVDWTYAQSNGYVVVAKTAEESADDIAAANKVITASNETMLTQIGKFQSSYKNYSTSLSDLTEKRVEEKAALDKASAGYWVYDEAGTAVYEKLESVKKKILETTVAFGDNSGELEDLSAQEEDLKNKLANSALVWGQNSSQVAEHKTKLAEIDDQINKLKQDHARDV